MRKMILIIVCLIGMQAMAQNIMRVTKNDGISYEFSINNVNSIIFYTPQKIEIIGEWIAVSGGSMSCFDIKEDGTLKYKSFEMDMGFKYEWDETYTINDNVLRITMSGQILEIEIIEYTNSMIVASDGTIYYKVQEPFYKMNTTDAPIKIGNNEDVIKYTDNCFVGIVDNKIKAIRKGTGYALVEDTGMGIIKAFKIDVEYVPEAVIEWISYFKMSEDNIIDIFGDPDQVNIDKHSITYLNYNSSIQNVSFVFSEDFLEVTEIHLSFFDQTCMQHYCDSIDKQYVLNKTSSTSKIYYDTEDINEASVKITVYDPSSMCTIIYKDMKTTPALAVDWTQYLKKSGDQIKAQFGSNPDITEDDEYEEYTMDYYNISPYKYISFSFNKGFEKVTSIRVSFQDASSMQGHCDAIAAKYILYSDTGTRKTYYDTDSPSTASVRIIINSSGSSNYISYLDMSE